MTVNGVEVPVDSVTGFYQADVSVGTEGISQIMVVATDTAGNTVEFSVPLTYNLTSNSNPDGSGVLEDPSSNANDGTTSNSNPDGVATPTIIFTEPSSQQVFTNIPSTITIQGSVANTLSNIASVTVNGVEVQVDPVTGFFKTDVRIDEEGTSQVKVVATDVEGKITESFVSVTYDVTPPILVLTEPSSPQVITNLPSTIRIQGTAGDALSGITSMTVNGVAVQVDPVSGFFQADVSVGVEGISQIMVVATDAAGNTAEFSVPLTYNLTSNSNPDGSGVLEDPSSNANDGTTSNSNPDGVATPTIIFTEPSSQQVFTNIPSTITIQGSVANTLSNIASVTVNGVEVQVDPVTGFFKTDVRIDEEGTSQVKVVATDVEGKITESFVSVTYDVTPPILVLTEPSSPQVITNLPSTIRIQGTAGDALSGITSMTVNGVAVQVDPVSGFFQADVSVGVEGISQIMVVATDAAGNTAEFSVPLTYNLTSNSNPDGSGVLEDPSSNANDGTTSNSNPDGVATPTIIFTEPSSQQVFTNIPSTITIQGSVANTLSNIASVTVNGVEVQVDPVTGFFKTDVRIDEEGTSQVKVVATDVEGKITESFVSVTYDVTPPILVLTEPSSPQVITNLPSTIRIQGTAGDALSGITSMTVNGVAVQVDPVSGFFQADVSVGVEGISQIMVVATDAAGNTAEFSVPLTYNLTSNSNPDGSGVLEDPSSNANDGTTSNSNPDGVATPTIIFTEPSSQQVFTNIPSTITIQGSVANTLSNIASVTVNGVEVQVDPVTGFFKTDVRIDEEGTSQVKVVATDVEGKITESFVSVTYDVTPPILVLTEPSSPQVITNLPSTIRIQGTAGDALSGITSMTVNGVAVQVDPVSGFFQADVSVGVEGISQIMVVATDAAGNTAEFSVPLTYNLTSNSNPDGSGVLEDPSSNANDGTTSNSNPDGVATPTIIFTEPSSQQVFTNIPSTITIQGSVANTLSNIASVTVNGVEVQVDPVTGFFKTDVRIDEEGTSQVKVVATDVEGKITESFVSVTYDVTPPILVLTEPSSPQVITNLPSTIRIQGTAGDALSGITSMTVNGVAVQVDPVSGFFQADVSVGVEDISQIMVVATDAAGNTVEFSVPLTYNLTSNSNPSTGTSGS